MEQDAQATTSAAEGARAVPVQGSSGGFKLKLKFGGAPVVPSSQRPKEDDEDQLAGGSSSDDESGSYDDEDADLDDVDGSSVVSGSTSVARPYPHEGGEGSDGGSRLSSLGPSDDEASTVNGHHLQAPHQPGAPGSDDTRSAGDGASEADTSVPAAPTEQAPAAPPAPAPASKKRKRPSTAGKAKGANGLLAPPKAKAPASKKKRSAASAASGGYEDAYSATMAQMMMMPPPPPRERRPHDPSLGPPPPPPVGAPRPWPTAPPPKTAAGFLPSQPLERRLPPPRTWRRAYRDMIGVSGFPLRLWTYAGDPQSEFADAKRAAQLAMPPPQLAGAPPGFLPGLSGPPGSVPQLAADSAAVTPLPTPPASSIHPDYRAGAPALGGPPLPASFGSVASTPEKTTPTKGKTKTKSKPAVTLAPPPVATDVVMQPEPPPPAA